VTTWKRGAATLCARPSKWARHRFDARLDKSWLHLYDYAGVDNGVEIGYKRAARPSSNGANRARRAASDVIHCAATTHGRLCTHARPRRKTCSRRRLSWFIYSKGMT
jgi:hypothetical protein